VEIVKMLYRGAEVLILDEPTAALSPPEWQDLSVFLRSLAAGGKSIIFITHKLDELFGVADCCTVLRDGKNVGTVAMTDTDKPKLAHMMVGRPVSLRVERPVMAPGEPVLDVKGLTLVEDGRTLLDGIEFQVREREVFGVVGVDGNGQVELVETLIGLRKPTAGEISMNGTPLANLDPQRFTDLGGAVIPEDRHREAVALELTLLENLTMKELESPRFVRRGVLDLAEMERHSGELVSQYDIRTRGVHMQMRNLSGGNQQKAVLARELSRKPRLLIASQPTRGLDVGAMEFVYNQLNATKEAGGAVLLLSIELDEVLSLSDRVAVMVGGRFVGMLDADETDLQTLGLLMAGEEAEA
jgi:simple sugar transport system ATP-binding protein